MQGHVKTTKGLIPEAQLAKTVLHHAREVTVIGQDGRVTQGTISTRHTEHFLDGELVRRDVHVGAGVSTPHVAHDAKGHNEALEKRIAAAFPPRVFSIASSGAAAVTAPNPFDEMLEAARRGLAILAGLTTSLCTSFKVELLKAIHDFTNGNDVFKMALFKANALIVGTYGAATVNYTDMTGNGDELANGNGYTTGGVALTNTTPISTGTVAYTTPSAAAQWTGATFTTRGCLTYNNTKATRGWFVYDFGADEPVVSGTLTVSMPANDNTHALTRIS